MEKVFSNTLILHEGRVLAYDDCDTLREKGSLITCNMEVVDRFIEGKRYYPKEHLVIRRRQFSSVS